MVALGTPILEIRGNRNGVHPLRSGHFFQTH